MATLAGIAGAATPPGTDIINSAQADFTVAGAPRNNPSNTVTLTTISQSTPASIELFQYAPGPMPPGSPSPQNININLTQCGDGAGGFGPMPPLTAFNGTPLGLPAVMPLLPTSVYSSGEPLFVRVSDPDQNLDPAVQETIDITLTIATTGESEQLRLTETALNTGVFTGAIQTVASNVVPFDCTLSVADEVELEALYVDPTDGADTAVAGAVVDPFGIVFNSSNGNPINGATVELLDASGQPATVLDVDGTTAFPNVVISGGQFPNRPAGVTFPPGEYRFPLVTPGNYQLRVTPPTGFGFPSTVATATLIALPGGPFLIVTGSRGEPFTVPVGPAVRIDIPLDPVSSQLFITKDVNTSIVSQGDFLQYRITVENSNTAAAVSDVTVIDKLPLGFRYRAGSSKRDGVSITDPAIAADGRTLTFTLGTLPPASTTILKYVVEVTAGALVHKEAVNTALATAPGGISSNLGTATVTVRDELFQSRAFIMGRVIIGNCDATMANNVQGLPGIRVYLEDGTYAMTDGQGKYHFEDIRPGTHVVQVDVGTLPPGYEPTECHQNSRHAGRAYSQFVNLQGGTLWRADFRVQPKAPARGTLMHSLTTDRDAGQLRYELAIDVTAVPVSALSAMVSLPAGAEYITGSSTLNGRTLPDPPLLATVATFKIGKFEAETRNVLTLRATLPAGDDAPTSKSYLMFDAPAQSGLTSGVADSTPGDPPTSISMTVHGAPADRSLTPVLDYEALLAEGAVADRPAFDAAWLAAARPGLEWIWPASAYIPHVPAIKLAIKFDPSQQLEILRNGEPINPYSYEGTLANEAGTVGLGLWRAVSVYPGENVFEVVQRDQSGVETDRIHLRINYPGPPVRAEFVAEHSVLVSDGRTAPTVAVKFYDVAGEPVKHGVIGYFSLEPPYQPLKFFEREVEEALILSGTDKPRYRVGNDGIARIRLLPTTQPGEVVLRFNFYQHGELLVDDRRNEIRARLQTPGRDWIVVGLATGTLAHRTISGNMEALERRDLGADWSGDGRVAFFAKGKIRGKWLLTMAYDTAESTGEDSNRRHQQIDPDTYYTVYGDAAEQYAETPSSDKLYLKIERGQFYAMFGDVDTGLTVTELARYSRTLTGFKSEYESDRFEYNVFAAETSLAFVKDEIRGDGTSGLYHLSRTKLVVNSEKLAIQTRDRFRSERILSVENMTRHIDYNIDYDDGTVFFKRPIPSQDHAFNPVFIVVDYESDDKLDAAINGGGRGAVNLLDGDLTIGVSGIREGNKGREGRLLGLDLTHRLGARTTFEAEVAHSDTREGTDENSGSAYIAEIVHRSSNVDATAYFREQQAGFGLGQQHGSETGTRKIGASASYRVQPQLTFTGEAYHEDNLSTDAERDGANAIAELRTQAYSYYGGLRWARDAFSHAGSRQSNLLIAGARINPLGHKLALTVDTEFALDGEADNADYPNRVIAGAEYQLSHKQTLFAQQEFSFNDDERDFDTRVGTHSAPCAGASFTSAIERQQTEAGARIFATSGLYQSLRFNEQWSFDLGLDRTQTLKDPGNPAFNVNVPAASGSRSEDFTAVSAGANYDNDVWLATSRAEFRHSDNSDKWNLSLSGFRQLENGVSGIASLKTYINRSNNGNRENTSDLRVGFAYRPADSAWIILDRTDFIYERQRSGGFDRDSRRFVNNVNANYQYNPRTQIALHYGVKYTVDTFDDDDFSGVTDVIGGEVRFDLGRHWDIGGHAHTLRNWESDNRQFSFGPTLGFSPIGNIWVGVGYNFDGFRDDDFATSEFTSKGPYLFFRLKIDQGTANSVKNWLSK